MEMNVLEKKINKKNVFLCCIPSPLIIFVPVTSYKFLSFSMAFDKAFKKDLKFQQYKANSKCICAVELTPNHSISMIECDR